MRNNSIEPKIIWKPFVEELLDGIVEFDPNQEILIGDLKYLKEVALLLSSTDDELIG